MIEWAEEPLSEQHDCGEFDSGEREIDRYLLRFALPNHVAGVSKTFVAVLPDEPARVVGYYSIAPAQVSFSNLPLDLRSRLPRYPAPGFRLARLGVTREHQGQGLGKELVFAAAIRAIEASAEVGGLLMVIDAMSDDLVEWYRRHFAATPLVDVPRSVIVDLAVFADALSHED